MKNVNGRMTVNTIDGRFGQFNIATLYCDIGDFVVRYSSLDEFNAGTYEGEFFISKIDLRTRDFGVGKIIEPIAYLDGLNLFDADEGCTEEIAEAIIDPLIEEEESLETKDEIVTVLPAMNQGDEFSSDSNDTDIEFKQLFGELWPLEEMLKLDPTVGRAIFRDQRDYLKLNGYVFNPKDQSWIKKH